MMLKNAYDKYYIEQDYFGEPYPGLVEFFKKHEPKCTVLDLGCGQGRDALLLGRLGYEVVGVDSSSVGIEQLNQIALKEKLSVKGVVGDMYSYPISDGYDMVLLDSIFHFYSRDKKREKDFLIRILAGLKPGGILCNFMQQGEEREKYYRKSLTESGHQIELIEDGYTDYPEYEGRIYFHMLRKTSE
jgi:SAM-dependent methyltransferase